MYAFVACMANVALGLLLLALVPAPEYDTHQQYLCFRCHQILVLPHGHERADDGAGGDLQL